MNGYADISTLSHGMSVQKISEYYEDLKVNAIREAVQACNGAAYTELKNALNSAWVGTSHDKFVEILDKSTQWTAGTIAQMTVALATELNRIIETWRTFEDNMIAD